MKQPTPVRRVAAIALLCALTGAGVLAVAQVEPAPKSVPAPSAKATFAGGCFWCVEADFDKIDGVLSTTSGYIGGKLANPTYEQVSSDRTGHTEAVEVVYDPSKVSYARLLDVFWHNIDPTVSNRQFCDVGASYRSAIFTHGPEQLNAANESKAKLDATRPFKAPIVTEVVPASAFYPAETYHQDYYKKNPLRYRLYRTNCGRDARLKELWGDRAGGG